MAEDHSLYHLLGKLEGKMDAIMASVSAHQDTTDNHSKRISGLEAEIAALKAGQTQNRSWLSTLVAVFALALSAFGVFLKV